MEFSRRTAWDRRLNQLALRTEVLRSQGAELIDLTEANPTRCGFDYPERELSAAVSSAEVRGYNPDPKGLGSAREALASRWRSEGAAVGPEQILLCSGTSEAYAYLLKLLCDPGDNVLVPAPCYPLLEYLAALESVELRRYPLHFAGGWRMDFGALTEALDHRTRAVLAINPGYPTGSFLTVGEFDSLSALCSERRCAIICDEVFSDYAVGDSRQRLTTVLGRPSLSLTFSLGGLSKKAGLPQAKVGWLCASGPEQVRLEALARLEIIADTYLSTSTVMQSALPRLLELSGGISQQIRRRMIENRSALLAREPGAARWSVLPSEGGWSAVLRLPDGSDEESLCLGLLERGLIVQPGYFFDFPRGKFLVLSVIAPRETFDRGLEILASI